MTNPDPQPRYITAEQAQEALDQVWALSRAIQRGQLVAAELDLAAQWLAEAELNAEAVLIVAANLIAVTEANVARAVEDGDGEKFTRTMFREVIKKLTEGGA